MLTELIQKDDDMFKKFKFRWFLMLILAGLCLFGTLKYRSHKRQQKVEARIAAVAKTHDQAKKVAASDYPGIDIATTTEDDADFRRVIQRPLFESQALGAPVDEFVDKVVKNFNHAVQNMIKAVKLEEFNTVPSLAVNFNVYPFGDDLYSIVFQVEEFLGGSTRDEYSKIFLVNLKKEELIDPKTLIADDELPAIEKEVTNYLVEEKDIDTFFIEEYFKDQENQASLLDHMYFTEEDVVFLFDKYTVAAGAEGMPEARFVLDDFNQYLEQDFRMQLGYIKDGAGRIQVKGADRWDGIEKPPVITHHPEAGKKAALTFDDGPHAVNTLKIMELLRQYDAKATFFMIGSTADFYPELVARVIAAGHEVGEHSWTHRDFTTLSEANIRSETAQCDAAIQKVTQWTPQLFRPPYGAHNDFVDQVLADRHIVLWSVDTLDWKSHDPQAILSIVKEQIHDGAIILMHDVHDSTVDAVPLVLDYLTSQGYELVTVSELFE